MVWTLWIGLGSLLAGLGVGLGAFGAHYLKSRVAADYLAVFETATRYHLIHALGLILVGLIATRIDNGAIKIAGLCLFLGMLLFSGSLYALVLTGNRALGAITPLGGLLLIAGWVVLGISMLRIGA